MKEGAVTCQERKKQEVLKKNRKRDEIYNTTGNYSGSMCGKPLNSYQTGYYKKRK